MQIGTSVASATVRSMACQQLGLVDQRDAGVDVEHVGAGLAPGPAASTVTVDRSPPRSSSANVLRPVGLMRSPMTQNGWSWPMTTVLERDAESCAYASDFSLSMRGSRPSCVQSWAMPASLRNEMRCRPADAGQRQRVGGQLVGELEARLLLVGGRLDALDDRRGDLVRRGPSRRRSAARGPSAGS